MKQDKKYEQMKRRSVAYGFCGFGCNVISYLADENDNTALSNIATVAGIASSTASLINFIRSIEKYELEDTNRFFINHLGNMVIMPVIDSLSLAFSLSPKEKKKQLINRIKGKTDPW